MFISCAPFISHTCRNTKEVAGATEEGEGEDEEEDESVSGGGKDTVQNLRCGFGLATDSRLIVTVGLLTAYVSSDALP